MKGLIAVSSAAVGFSPAASITFTKRSNKTEGVGSGKDLKLQRIINKFKGGKRLTSGELSYLAQEAPSIYQKVQRIMQQREQLEEKLEQAETKEEVQLIMMNELQSVEKFCAGNDDDFEKTALINQLMDAYGEVVKSDAYQAMPASEEDLLELESSAWENEALAAEVAGEDEESLLSEETSAEGNPFSPEMSANDNPFSAEMQNGFHPLPDKRQNDTGVRSDTQRYSSEKSSSRSGDHTVSAEGKAKLTTDSESTRSHNRKAAAPAAAEPVTYNASGKKKSASGASVPKGRRVNVAI